MKFFSKKRRADGVEIARYHGEGFCNTSEAETYSNVKGDFSKASYNAVEVTENKVKETVKTGTSVFTINSNYTDRGPKLDINLSITYPYNEFTVFELPASCSKCPVGFQKGAKCGRNVPFTGEDYKRRAATCKLKKVNFEEIKNIMEVYTKRYFY
jgi:hypothetical protein